MAQKKDLREQAAEHADLILTGNLLALDPSSTSLGWAVFEKGTYKDGGAKKYRGDINVRLHKIHHDVLRFIEDNFIDILVVERLRPVTRPPRTGAYSYRTGDAGGGAYTPVELLWSVGAALSGVPIPFIEVSPSSWKVSAKELGLEKSDANDARAMGDRMVKLAKEG